MDSIVCSSGSGGVQAGMIIGYQNHPNAKIIGISSRRNKVDQTNHIHDLTEATLRHLTSNTTAEFPKAAVVVKDDYIGPGYAIETEESKEAITLFSTLEGIQLDPVYTGKAAAGLIDMVHKDEFPEGSNVLFLHTGGTATASHYQPPMQQKRKKPSL